MRVKTQGIRVTPPSTRLLTAFLAAVYFLANAPFLYAAESNLWDERRRAAVKDNSSPMAALPAASGADPLTILKGLPSVQSQSLSPDVIERLKADVPEEVLSRQADLLRAIPPSQGHIRRLSLPAHPREGKTVVFLQDVHNNDEAQGNLAGIVSSLASTGRVSFVGLEAAFEPLNVDKYRSLEDQDALRMAADYFLKEHQISGPMHTALTAKGPLPPFIGVDDEPHYQANVEAYRRSAPAMDEAKYRLAVAARRLAKEKAAVYNGELSKFDRVVDGYHREDVPFGDYVAELARRGGASGQLGLFTQALEMEKSMDFKAVEEERTRLVETVVRTWPKAQVERLLQISVGYRAGNLTHTDYYRALRDLCRGNGVDLGTYPAMDEYVRYVMLSGKIDADKLFREVLGAEKAVYARLAKTEEEKRLVGESRRLTLTAKLLDFSLTPDEWAEYRSIPSPLRGEGKGEGDIDLSSFESFYQEAEARNQAMTDKVLKSLAAKNGAAVLVAGGFHTTGMTRLLMEKGVTVIEVAPKLTKVEGSGSAYLGVFTQEKTPLEQIFKGNKLFVADVPGKAMSTGAMQSFLSLSAVIRTGLSDKARALWAALGAPGKLENVTGGEDRAREDVVTDGGRVRLSLKVAGGAGALFTATLVVSFGTRLLDGVVTGVTQQIYFFAVLSALAGLLSAGALYPTLAAISRVLGAAFRFSFSDRVRSAAAVRGLAGAAAGVLLLFGLAAQAKPAGKFSATDGTDRGSERANEADAVLAEARKDPKRFLGALDARRSPPASSVAAVEWIIENRRKEMDEWIVQAVKEQAQVEREMAEDKATNSRRQFGLVHRHTHPPDAYYLAEVLAYSRHKDADDLLSRLGYPRNTHPRARGWNIRWPKEVPKPRANGAPRLDGSEDLSAPEERKPAPPPTRRPRANGAPRLDGTEDTSALPLEDEAPGGSNADAESPSLPLSTTDARVMKAIGDAVSKANVPIARLGGADSEEGEKDLEDIALRRPDLVLKWLTDRTAGSTASARRLALYILSKSTDKGVKDLARKASETPLSLPSTDALVMKMINEAASKAAKAPIGRGGEADYEEGTKDFEEIARRRPDLALKWLTDRTGDSTASVRGFGLHTLSKSTDKGVKKLVQEASETKWKPLPLPATDAGIMKAIGDAVSKANAPIARVGGPDSEEGERDLEDIALRRPDLVLKWLTGRPAGSTASGRSFGLYILSKSTDKGVIELVRKARAPRPNGAPWLDGSEDSSHPLKDDKTPGISEPDAKPPSLPDWGADAADMSNFIREQAEGLKKLAISFGPEFPSVYRVENILPSLRRILSDPGIPEGARIRLISDPSLAPGYWVDGDAKGPRTYLYNVNGSKAGLLPQLPFPSPNKAMGVVTTTRKVTTTPPTAAVIKIETRVIPAPKPNGRKKSSGKFKGGVLPMLAVVGAGAASLLSAGAADAAQTFIPGLEKTFGAYIWDSGVQPHITTSYFWGPDSVYTVFLPGWSQSLPDWAQSFVIWAQALPWWGQIIAGLVILSVPVVIVLTFLSDRRRKEWRSSQAYKDIRAIEAARAAGDHQELDRIGDRVRDRHKALLGLIQEAKNTGAKTLRDSDRTPIAKARRQATWDLFAATAADLNENAISPDPKRRLAGWPPEHWVKSLGDLERAALSSGDEGPLAVELAGLFKEADGQRKAAKRMLKSIGDFLNTAPTLFMGMMGQASKKVLAELASFTSNEQDVEEKLYDGKNAAMRGRVMGRLYTQGGEFKRRKDRHDALDVLFEKKVHPAAELAREIDGHIEDMISHRQSQVRNESMAKDLAHVQVTEYDSDGKVTGSHEEDQGVGYRVAAAADALAAQLSAQAANAGMTRLHKEVLPALAADKTFKEEALAKSLPKPKARPTGVDEGLGVFSVLFLPDIFNLFMSMSLASDGQSARRKFAPMLEAIEGIEREVADRREAEAKWVNQQVDADIEGQMAKVESAGRGSPRKAPPVGEGGISSPVFASAVAQLDGDQVARRVKRSGVWAKVALASLIAAFITLAGHFVSFTSEVRSTARREAVSRLHDAQESLARAKAFKADILKINELESEAIRTGNEEPLRQFLEEAIDRVGSQRDRLRGEEMSFLQSRRMAMLDRLEERARVQKEKERPAPVKKRSRKLPSAGAMGLLLSIGAGAATHLFAGGAEAAELLSEGVAAAATSNAVPSGAVNSMTGPGQAVVWVGLALLAGGAAFLLARAFARRRRYSSVSGRPGSPKPPSFPKELNGVRISFSRGGSGGYGSPAPAELALDAPTKAAVSAGVKSIVFVENPDVEPIYRKKSTLFINLDSFDVNKSDWSDEVAEAIRGYFARNSNALAPLVGLVVMESPPETAAVGETTVESNERAVGEPAIRQQPLNRGTKTFLALAIFLALEAMAQAAVRGSSAPVSWLPGGDLPMLVGAGLLLGVVFKVGRGGQLVRDRQSDRKVDLMRRLEEEATVLHDKVVNFSGERSHLIRQERRDDEDQAKIRALSRKIVDAQDRIEEKDRAFYQLAEKNLSLPHSPPRHWLEEGRVIGGRVYLSNGEVMPAFLGEEEEKGVRSLSVDENSYRVVLGEFGVIEHAVSYHQLEIDKGTPKGAFTAAGRSWFAALVLAAGMGFGLFAQAATPRTAAKGEAKRPAEVSLEKRAGALYEVLKSLGDALHRLGDARQDVGTDWEEPETRIDLKKAMADIESVANKNEALVREWLLDVSRSFEEDFQRAQVADVLIQSKDKKLRAMAELALLAKPNLARAMEGDALKAAARNPRLKKVVERAEVMRAINNAIAKAEWDIRGDSKEENDRKKAVGRKDFEDLARRRPDLMLEWLTEPLDDSPFSGPFREAAMKILSKSNDPKLNDLARKASEVNKRLPAPPPLPDYSRQPPPVPQPIIQPGLAPKTPLIEAGLLGADPAADVRKAALAARKKIEVSRARGGKPITRQSIFSVLSDHDLDVLDTRAAKEFPVKKLNALLERFQRVVTENPSLARELGLDDLLSSLRSGKTKEGLVVKVFHQEEAYEQDLRSSVEHYREIVADSPALARELGTDEVLARLEAQAAAEGRSEGTRNREDAKGEKLTAYALTRTDETPGEVHIYLSGEDLVQFFGLFHEAREVIGLRSLYPLAPKEALHRRTVYDEVKLMRAAAAAQLVKSDFMKYPGLSPLTVWEIRSAGKEGWQALVDGTDGALARIERDFSPDRFPGLTPEERAAHISDGKVYTEAVRALAKDMLAPAWADPTTALQLYVSPGTKVEKLKTDGTRVLPRRDVEAMVSRIEKAVEKAPEGSQPRQDMADLAKALRQGMEDGEDDVTIPRVQVLYRKEPYGPATTAFAKLDADILGPERRSRVSVCVSGPPLTALDGLLREGAAALVLRSKGEVAAPEYLQDLAKTRVAEFTSTPEVMKALSSVSVPGMASSRKEHEAAARVLSRELERLPTYRDLMVSKQMSKAPVKPKLTPWQTVSVWWILGVSTLLLGLVVTNTILKHDFGQQNPGDVIAMGYDEYLDSPNFTQTFGDIYNLPYKKAIDRMRSGTPYYDPLIRATLQTTGRVILEGNDASIELQIVSDPYHQIEGSHRYSYWNKPAGIVRHSLRDFFISLHRAYGREVPPDFKEFEYPNPRSSRPNGGGKIFDLGIATITIPFLVSLGRSLWNAAGFSSVGSSIGTMIGIAAVARLVTLAVVKMKPFFQRFVRRAMDWAGARRGLLPQKAMETALGKVLSGQPVTANDLALLGAPGETLSVFQIKGQPASAPLNSEIIRQAAGHVPWFKFLGIAGLAAASHLAAARAQSAVVDRDAPLEIRLAQATEIVAEASANMTSPEAVAAHLRASLETKPHRATVEIVRTVEEVAALVSKLKVLYGEDGALDGGALFAVPEERAEALAAAITAALLDAGLGKLPRKVFPMKGLPLNPGAVPWRASALNKPTRDQLKEWGFERGNTQLVRNLPKGMQWIDDLGPDSVFNEFEAILATYSPLDYRASQIIEGAERLAQLVAEMA